MIGFFIAFLLPCVIDTGHLCPVFLSQLDILFLVGTAHLPQIHEQDFSLSVAVALNLAVLLHHTGLFILIQNPESHTDVGSIEQVAGQDDDGLHQIVFNQLPTNF